MKSIKQYIPFAIAGLAVACAAVWGAQQIFRCIENILLVVLFFVAVALGG